MKRISFTMCLLFLSTGLLAQMELPDLKAVKKVVVKNYWGDQHIKGVSYKEGRFTLYADYTDTSKKRLDTPAKLAEYVSVRIEKDVLYIEARKPEGFESIALFLQIPSRLQVASELIKGGNISIEDIDGGVEVNSLNGSVKLKKIAGYALVSAANGEVDVEFEKVDASKAISLITLNGGVSATLPNATARDVRLISRKNGYIESQFTLDSDRPIKNLNTTAYSKYPIVHTAKINGGGPLLFLSTQNGPIALRKWD